MARRARPGAHVVETEVSRRAVLRLATFEVDDSVGLQLFLWQPVP
jgi:hypothetical protein